MNLIPWKSKRPSNGGEDLLGAFPLARIRSEMDRMFERVFGSDWGMIPEGLAGSWTWAPTLDVSETEREVHVRAEVPGVDPKELQITVADRVLTIAGEKRESRERKDENYFRSERRFGSFRRSIQLPASVDPDNVEAEHKNGVLRITLQKKPGALPRRISVRSAAE